MEPTFCGGQFNGYCSPPKSPRQRTFTLTVNIDGTDYRVSPQGCDPAIGSKAYRVHKLTADDKVYDLYLSPHGWACDCPGHTHHGHCKHAEVINRLCLLFHPPMVAASASEV